MAGVNTDDVIIKTEGVEGVVGCKPRDKCPNRLEEQVSAPLVTTAHDVRTGFVADFAAGAERVSILVLIPEEVVRARNVVHLL